MVAILLDKINYNKMSKYANVLIFKEFYPKTKNVSYYLNMSKSSHIRKIVGDLALDFQGSHFRGNVWTILLCNFHKIYFLVT